MHFLHPSSLQSLKVGRTPISLFLFCILAVGMAGHLPAQSTNAPAKFVELRQKFTTKLIRKESAGEKTQPPPKDIFNLVQYESPVGKLDAYVGIDPKDGKKHPAIIWLVGGFSNSIGDEAWTKGPADNDQSATAFREAGMIMMYPSLRGGNANPGFKEGLYGEVDDVLAALKYLKSLSYVDPQRIYLGGHSTGGTLALLVAETTQDFRAILAFGPVHSAISYGKDVMPFDTTDKTEMYMRAPVLWLQDITTPTFVIEGTGRGNVEPLRLMKRHNKNPKVSFFEIEGATHFNLLRPLTKFMAEKFVADKGPTVDLTITSDELNKAFHSGT